MATNDSDRKPRKLKKWVQSSEPRWAAMLNLAHLSISQDPRLEKAMDQAADAAVPIRPLDWRETMRRSSENA